jgi:hypothetical protein
MCNSFAPKENDLIRKSLVSAEQSGMCALQTLNLQLQGPERLCTSWQNTDVMKGYKMIAGECCHDNMVIIYSVQSVSNDC